IERLTVGELIERLQQFPASLPVIVRSYEEGYDPVTEVQVIRVAETADRAWYVGVYEATDEHGETALLLASKYHRTE
ncbi:MAG: hypothetical protein IAE80_29985, partial [Anaerolinea sp.]|nr:hypothetical protein [Anaerolinea sp.]